jgi:hypothetical protein
MKYDSLREYFYKFYNVLYALILVPMLAFVFLYFEIQSQSVRGPYKDDHFLSRIVVIAMMSLVVLVWIVSFVHYFRKLPRIRTIGSLGERLDEYYTLTSVRFVSFTASSLALAAGFLLTEHQVLTLTFVVSFVLALVLWPLPSKVCRDLQLRGDERTLVLYKKDTL